MGVYDSFYDSQGTEYQTKVGPCAMAQYRPGDKVNSDFPNGIIKTHWGFVVIWQRVFINATDNEEQAERLLEQAMVETMKCPNCGHFWEHEHDR